MAEDSVIEDGGSVLADWACDQARMRSIIARPFGIYDGKIAGELLYHAPGAVQPPPASPRGS